MNKKFKEYFYEPEPIEESIKTAAQSMAAAAMLGASTTTAIPQQKADTPTTIVNQQKQLKFKNNPGNIRYVKSNNWRGQIKPNRGFAQFSEVTYGLRAIIKILKNYENSYKLNTITGIITKYAPPNENKTKDYIKFVSDKIGISPNEQLNLFVNGKPDVDKIIRVVNAITNFETGTVYSPLVITAAISLL